MRDVISIVLLLILFSCNSPVPTFEVTIIKELDEVMNVENLNGDPIYDATNVFSEHIKCLVPEALSFKREPPYRAFVKKSSLDKYGRVYRIKN